MNEINYKLNFEKEKTKFVKGCLKLIQKNVEVDKNINFNIKQCLLSNILNIDTAFKLVESEKDILYLNMLQKYLKQLESFKKDNFNI